MISPAGLLPPFRTAAGLPIRLAARPAEFVKGNEPVERETPNGTSARDPPTVINRFGIVVCASGGTSPEGDAALAGAYTCVGVKLPRDGCGEDKPDNIFGAAATRVPNAFRTEDESGGANGARRSGRITGVTGGSPHRLLAPVLLPHTLAVVP